MTLRIGRTRWKMLHSTSEPVNVPNLDPSIQNHGLSGRCLRASVPVLHSSGIQEGSDPKPYTRRCLPSAEGLRFRGVNYDKYYGPLKDVMEEIEFRVKWRLKWKPSLRRFCYRCYGSRFLLQYSSGIGYLK